MTDRQTQGEKQYVSRPLKGGDRGGDIIKGSEVSQLDLQPEKTWVTFSGSIANLLSINSILSDKNQAY